MNTHGSETLSASHRRIQIGITPMPIHYALTAFLNASIL
jgi:hypothetical protein